MQYCIVAFKQASLRDSFEKRFLPLSKWICRYKTISSRHLVVKEKIFLQTAGIDKSKFFPAESSAATYRLLGFKSRSTAGQPVDPTSLNFFIEISFFFHSVFSLEEHTHIPIDEEPYLNSHQAFDSLRSTQLRKHPTFVFPKDNSESDIPLSIRSPKTNKSQSSKSIDPSSIPF